MKRSSGDTTSTAKDVERSLRAVADKARAENSQRFFKTCEGGYGEGDVFIGITVPIQRKIAKQYRDLAHSEVATLLSSPVHECRFVGLAILVLQYRSATLPVQEKIVKFYLKHKVQVNNWDLVDATAPYILGDWLLDHDRAVLYKLVKSKSLWDRRIAVVATAALIQKGEYNDTLELATLLLEDKEDLMHKAVGWMLREVGKKSPITLERFLDKQVAKMPRTMLRYAIERFPEEKRLAYLAVKKQT